MKTATHFIHPNANWLLDIIKLQTDIAKLGLDLGGVMMHVTMRAKQMTGANGAVIELAEGDDMVYRAVDGITARQLGLRLSRKTSLSGLCVQRGEALKCADSENDIRVDRAACRTVGLRSMVVVPLKFADVVVGVLKVMSPEVDAFDDRDVSVLTLMSELVAASMYHAAQYGENELYHRATHDALTGLPNRALFYDRLRQALHLAGRSTSGLGVLAIDMDGLKTINDRHGHRAGDAAIFDVAQRLKKEMRLSDTVARLGGDEFEVIMPGIPARELAEEQCRRLMDAVAMPFQFEGRDLTLGVSVGAAFFPYDGDEPASLLESADMRMYSSKRARKAAPAPLRMQVAPAA